MNSTLSTLSLLALALALALPATAQPPAAEQETWSEYGFQGEFEEEVASEPFDDSATQGDPWSDAGTEGGAQDPFDPLEQSQHDAFATDEADPQVAADAASEPVDGESPISGELKDGLKRIFVGVLMPAVERRVRKAVEGDDAPQSEPLPHSDP